MRPILRNAPVAFAAAFLLVSAGSPSAEAADDKAIRDAQARFAEGLARVKKGDFEAARISFVQAYVVLHKPDILWNLALAEEKSGHSLDALAHFKELTNTAEAPDDRANAQKHAGGLMAQTGHIDVKAPQGTVLTIDSVQRAGTTPLLEPIDVLPGRHVVEGKTADGTKSVTVDTAAGETVAANLQPTPAAAGSPATSAPEAAPAASGSDPLGLSYGTAGSASTPAGADGASPSSAKIITTTALGAAGLVAVGVGVYFGLQSQSDGNTAAGFRSKYPSSYCSNPSNVDCSAWNSAVEGQNRDATASNALYVTGGVLVAGAVATWLFWPDAPNAHHEPAAWVVPVVGPTQASLALTGEF